ncbi:MAG: alpha/beta hydrolase [Pseudomonadota bacterium]
MSTPIRLLWMLDGVAQKKVITFQDWKLSCWECGEGPVVLLLHGYPDTPTTWKQAVPALVDAGYRVLVPTLPGYERSSINVTGFSIRAYRAEALAAALARVVDYCSSEPIHLIGHDWGSSVAFSLARYCPERLRSLTLMALPHPHRFANYVYNDRSQRRASRYIFFFQLPGIAEALLRSRGFRGIERLWERWSPGWGGSEEAQQYLAAVKQAFSDPLVLRAALSYYRAALWVRDSKSRDLVRGQVAVPTLGLFGQQDRCILPDTFRACMDERDFVNGLRVAAIDGAGHFFHLERPEETHAEILAHLAVH